MMYSTCVPAVYRTASVVSLDYAALTRATGGPASTSSLIDWFTELKLPGLQEVHVSRIQPGLADSRLHIQQNMVRFPI